MILSFLQTSYSNTKSSCSWTKVPTIERTYENVLSYYSIGLRPHSALVDGCVPPSWRSTFLRLPTLKSKKAAQPKQTKKSYFF